MSPVPEPSRHSELGSHFSLMVYFEMRAAPPHHLPALSLPTLPWPLVGPLAASPRSARQVEEHIGRIREELDREREERNYFQLERDKIHTFWEITRRQLEEKKAELRNKDREMEEAEERHQVEIKVRGLAPSHGSRRTQRSWPEVRGHGHALLWGHRPLCPLTLGA